MQKTPFWGAFAFKIALKKLPQKLPQVKKKPLKVATIKGFRR